MTDDTEFVSVRLPADVANWLRDYATSSNLIRAGKPNMGGSIIAVVRERMIGINDSQTMSNNVVPRDNLDIEAMIDSKIAALRDSINLEFVDIKNELAAIATSTSEAVAPVNFTEALIQKAIKSAPQKLMEAA